MNIYGMGQGQALGQGTFTFDKIAPNRYLLDRYANEDRILPGRYALIEYSHCIAEVKDWNENYSLEYDPGSKLYDIIKVKDGVISFEEGAEDKIFICVYDEEDKYYFYYANIPEPKTSIYYPIETQQESINYWIPYNNESLSIFEFNLQVDTAYANVRDNDDIILKNSAEGWDSTAWLKIIEKDSSGSNFKYINIADLNVIAPIISVTANQAYSFTAVQNNTLPSTTAVFLPPIVTQDESARATFDISFAKPMDINIGINIESTSQSDTATVTYEYTTTSKDFTLKLPEISRAINNANTATDNANDACSAVLSLIQYDTWPNSGNIPSVTAETLLPSNAGEVWEAIKATYLSAANANNAAIAANNAAGNVGDDILNVFTSNQVEVDWSISSAINETAHVTIPIKNKPEIYYATQITNLWDYGTTAPQSNS